MKRLKKALLEKKTITLHFTSFKGIYPHDIFIKEYDQTGIFIK